MDTTERKELDKLVESAIDVCMCLILSRDENCIADALNWEEACDDLADYSEHLGMDDDQICEQLDRVNRDARLRVKTRNGVSYR